MPKSAVYQVADRLAPKLRRQWLDAVTAIQDQVAEAILQGGSSARVAKVIASFHTQLRGVAATITRVFEESGQVVEGEIARRLRLQGAFEIVNPRAVDVAARQGAQLVREVTEDTRQAIRAVIARAIRDGIPPREAAKLIRPLVGLTERQAMAVINYRFSLLEAGATPDKVQRAAERYAAKLNRQRAETIARTETIRSASAGQQAAWQAAQVNGLLPQNALKTWNAAENERTCPACSSLDGKRVPLDEPFQATTGAVDGPPLHPMCRCNTSLAFPDGRAA